MFKKIGKGFLKAEESFTGMMFFIGIMIIFYNVVLRYVFHQPQAWAEDVFLIVLVWATVFGFDFNTADDDHIYMDIVYVKLKSKIAKRILDFISVSAMILYSAFITFYGFQAVAHQKLIGRTYTMTNIPFWVAYLVIIIVGALMLIHSIANLVKLIKRENEKEEVSE